MTGRRDREGTVSELRALAEATPGTAFSGAAVGTLMAVGNAGSLVVPVGMELLARETAGVADYRLSLVFLAVLGAIALAVVVFRVKETGPGGKESDRVEHTG